MRNRYFLIPLISVLFSQMLAVTPAATARPVYWDDFDQERAIGLASEGCPWVLNRDDITERFGYYEYLISNISLYRPTTAITNEAPLVFFVVHGTWAQASADYYDPDDVEYQKMFAFIQELARREQRPVEVVSFSWSGKDWPPARREAGSFLRLVCETFYAQRNGYGPRWAFGHSHGVNVINIASQEVDFDTVISLGAPVLEGTLPHYRPRHMKRLFHFYSINDPFQYAGSFDRRSLDKFFRKRSNGRSFDQQPDKRIVNARLMFDRYDSGHIGLRAAWPQLWDVLDLIEERYTYHNHFDVNLFLSLNQATHHFKAPIIAIRDDLKLRDMLPRLQDGESGLLVADALGTELDYSYKQERRFASCYNGRDIHKKCVWWRQWAANWGELSDTLVDYSLGLRQGAQRSYSLLEDVTD